MPRLLITLVALALAVGALDDPGKISQDDVLHVMAALDGAEQQRDAPKLFARLAPEFSITSKWEDGRVRSHMTLAEYKQFLTELFANAGDYKHSRGKVTVDIAPDGSSATARYETFQHEERPDKGKISWTDRETDTFALRGGSILLSSVETVLQSRAQTPP